MAGSNGNGGDRRGRRRWSFANSAFDEASWTLTVDGRRVSIEAKPLELLRELLLRAGDLVSKEELLDKIWPDVTVVEASLPTAIHKLRLALGDDRRERSIIETVPRIGYRLAVPVEVEDVSASPSFAITASQSAATDLHPETGGAAETGANRRWTANVPRRLALWGGLAVASAAIAFAVAPFRHISEIREVRSFNQRDAANALRKLDVEAIEKMVAAGWDPNTPFDKEDNGALNYLLSMCEWDPGHDRRKMLLMARTLLDGGHRLDRRNVWGDTPYSIAKAQRYCGPNHPITTMIWTLCYSDYKPTGDRCLAQYRTSQRAREAAMPPS